MDNPAPDRETRRIRLPITTDRKLEMGIDLVNFLGRVDDRQAALAVARQDAKEAIDGYASTIRRLRVDLKDGLEDVDVDVQVQVDFDGDRLLYVGMSGRWVGEVLEYRRMTSEERVKASQGRLFPEATPRAPDIKVPVGAAPPPAPAADSAAIDEAGAADPDIFGRVFAEGDRCSNCGHGWATGQPRRTKDGHARTSGKCYNAPLGGIACDCSAHMPIVHRVVIAGRNLRDDRACGIDKVDEARCYCGEPIGLMGEGVQVLARAFEGHVGRLGVMGSEPLDLLAVTGLLAPAKRRAG